jgi:uncharacterized protein (TIGR02145 family)
MVQTMQQGNISINKKTNNLIMKTNFKRLNCGILALILLSLSFGACKKDNTPAKVVKAPELSTDEVSGQSIGDATLKATITNTGGANITQCGFVWSSTEPLPTLLAKEGFTEEGAHNDQFSSTAIAFDPNKSYYIRAYATNSKGTSYGDAKYIVFDATENLYHTIKIGNQTWMLENLKTFKLNDISILYEQVGEWTAGAQAKMCWYNNQAISNKHIYGGLYNWYAANDPAIAPTGWHVPTAADWDQLITTVNNGNKATAGIVLKEATSAALSSHWETFNGISSTNASGFTALPGGYRRNDNASYASLGFYGHFWIKGGDMNGTVSYVRLDYNSDIFNVFTSATVNNSPTKNYGFSIRCVKDAAP